MNATGKRRLLKLADFLEELPKTRKFNMGLFAEKIKDGRPACGTAACAAGWAASIPAFRRAGYRLMQSRQSWGELLIVPAFGRHRADKALDVFFDITREDTINLFGSGNPNIPKNAASRIRNLVASKEARAA